MQTRPKKERHFYRNLNGYSNRIETSESGTSNLMGISAELLNKLQRKGSHLDSFFLLLINPYLEIWNFGSGFKP